MAAVNNPVLRGFHPDPSIVRVGDDFYIATSTFEWFPGVRIYHSRNLVYWDLAAAPLSRISQLDMAGNPASGGVWAPDLSFSNDLFYLVYTNVRTWTSFGSRLNDGFKDTHNYLVTAEKIAGPWSEPIYLNSSGFDPSLFHDDDGKKWLVNMLWDYRTGRKHFAGIIIQEWDSKTMSLKGTVEKIFDGTEIGFTEGPHIYRRNNWYYLLIAEGGTSYGHSVSIARSNSLFGPYEVHPDNPLLTSVRDRTRFNTLLEEGKDIFPALHKGLQKAGHGSMCEWKGKEWVLAHLCGRPMSGTGCCPLGRETALQKLIWKDDDWPYNSGGNKPVDTVYFTGPETEDTKKKERYYDFNKPALNSDFQSLRVPIDSLLSLTERPGWLRLTGHESISSPFHQSIVGLRIQNFQYYAETCMEFSPENFQQMAGLIIRYDERNLYYLRVSLDEDENLYTLGLIIIENGEFTMPLTSEQKFSANRIYLSVIMQETDIQFRYSHNCVEWQNIGPVLNSGKLSDDNIDPIGFTGMFLALGCQDLSGRKISADFNYLIYKDMENG